MQKFMTANEVCEITTLSKPTIWRLRQDGTFPNPINLSKNRVAYILTEIQEWMSQKVETSERVSAC